MVALEITPLQCVVLSAAMALTQHLDMVMKPAAGNGVPSDRSTLRMRSFVFRMSNNSLGTVPNSCVISGEYCTTYSLIRASCVNTAHNNIIYGHFGLLQMKMAGLSPPWHSLCSPRVVRTPC